MFGGVHPLAPTHPTLVILCFVVVFIVVFVVVSIISRIVLRYAVPLTFTHIVPV